MDPKTTQLDPKLKEAYDRVMGTVLPQNAPKPAETPVASTPAPTVTPPPIPIQPPADNRMQDVIDKQKAILKKDLESDSVSLKNNPLPPPIKTVGTFVAATPEVKKSGFPALLILVVGGVILLGYAFFWMTFFKVRLPFLP